MKPHFFLSALAVVLLTSECKPTPDSLEQASRINYSIPGKQIPFKWANCSKSLALQRQIRATLEKAWSDAENLLGMDNQMRGNSVNFALDSVNLTLEGENVNIFEGCIGSSGTTVSSGPDGAAANASAGEQCDSISKELAEAKARPLKPSQKCENASLFAGFAFRTTTRDVNLNANWIIKNSSKPTSHKFNFSFIELVGSAGGSATKIGGALLPIPEPAKGAMAALLDQIGTANFKAEFVKATILVQDAVKPKNAPAASPSRLAKDLAEHVLKPACQQYSKAFGLKLPCKVNDLEIAHSCAKDLDAVERMPIVNCEGGIGENRLYALLSKQTSTSSIDFLGEEGTQLTVFKKRADVKGLYKDGSAKYKGEANDFKKCSENGTIDSHKFKCIVATQGSILGCPQMGGGSRVLSLSNTKSLR